MRGLIAQGHFPRKDGSCVAFEPGPAILRLPGSREIRLQRQRLGRRRGAARSGARDAHGAD